MNTLHDPNCPDCKGRGKIELFTSVKDCPCRCVCGCSEPLIIGGELQPSYLKSLEALQKSLEQYALNNPIAAIPGPAVKYIHTVRRTYTGHEIECGQCHDRVHVTIYDPLPSKCRTCGIDYDSQPTFT